MHARQDQPEWVTLDSGASILVRGIHSDTAAKAVKQLPRSVRRTMIGQGQWTDRTWRHFCDYLADAVLLGWQGIAEDGQPLPYDRETARRVLAENYTFTWTVLEAARGDLEAAHA